MGIRWISSRTPGCRSMGSRRRLLMAIPPHDALSQFDIDGDGKTSPWEANICKMCLLAAIIIAFGDKALMFI
jgi:hypothetical protein